MAAVSLSKLAERLNVSVKFVLFSAQFEATSAPTLYTPLNSTAQHLPTAPACATLSLSNLQCAVHAAFEKQVQTKVCRIAFALKPFGLGLLRPIRVALVIVAGV